MSTLDEAHVSLFEPNVDDWEATASGSGFGILSGNFGGSVTSNDSYVVVGYALDGDNIATSGGQPVLLDMENAWYLPDGVYQAMPINTTFALE